MSKQFVRTGYKKDMFCVCEKVTGNNTKVGYCIVGIYYNIEDAMSNSNA